MNDPFRLARFVDAQEPIFDQACAELRAGAKRGHWMWFVFPQIEGLGASETARRFAISCRAEAEAYVRHPVLGPRLRECAELVNGVDGRSAREIFGHPDDLKFHSSMTLFAGVASDGAVFEDALQKYFAGRRDRLTMEKI
ncbi:MAG: DUF1810 domain-containing protein [Roseiarcus sp.]|jgi:uncharacterized protein (DUF1810 family)